MNYTPIPIKQLPKKRTRTPLYKNLLIGGFLLLVVGTGYFVAKSGLPSVLGLAADSRSSTPVLYWGFDEATGATVEDKSSSNNDGTISGSTRHQGSKCVAGNCAYLDGSNDYISKTYASDTELDFGTGSFTISTWFRHNSVTPATTQTLIDRYNGAGYRVYMNTSGNMCFGIDDDSTWGPDDSACSTTSYADNTWHFLSVVKTTTSSIRIYIDGKEVGSDTSLAATGSLSGTSPTFYAGTNSGGGTFTQTISATNRDGMDWTSWDGNSIYAGEWDGTAEIAAWHFSGVTIPQGATITSATMSMTAESLNNAAATDVLLEFDAEDTDTASLPSGTNRPSTMTVTTANVDWNLTAWVTDTVYESPDIASVIQEVVDRTGWSSGNNMNIILSPRVGTAAQGDIGIDDYGNGTPASIEIVWNTGVGETPFAGFIDELKVYNFAQTQAQINTDLTGPGAARGAGTTVGTKKLNLLSNGLLLHFPFDESSANTCAGGTNDSCDVSGNGYDGAWNGNTTSSAVAKFNRSVTFDGTSDYVSVADTANLRPGNGPYTVTFWANPINSNITAPLFSKQQTSGDYENISLTICGAIDCTSDGQNLLAVYRESETVERRFLSTADVTDGGFHMFTLVIDDVNQEMRVYVDGQRITAGTTVADGTWPTVNNPDNLRIGMDGVGTQSIDGEIDDFRIYRKALTDGEVSQLYSVSAGPVAYWKFDENSGTSFTDHSGNGYTGALNGTPIFGKGKYGTGITLNGTTQYGVINPQNGLNINAGSIMAWVNPSTTPASDQFLVMGNRETNRIYMLRLATTGNLGFRLGSSSVTDTGAAIAANTWTHVAITYNNGTYRTYINGNQVSTGSYSGIASLNGYSTIGAYDDLAGDVNSYFPGTIDEVKLYGYERTAGDITQDMNGDHPAPGSPVSSAMVHLKMDEGSGTTAYNSGNLGTSANGTMSSFSSPATSTSGWTENGKISNALIFDGSGDIISLGSGTSLDDLSAITVSAWIYPTGWGGGNFGRIVSKENASTAFGFTLVNDSSQGSIRIYRERSTSPAQATAATSSISLNTWQHVVGVLDTTNNIIKLYINGREVSSYIDQTMGSGTVNSDASNNMNIGNRTAADRGFSGRIDEVRIYNSVLTADQVSLLYNQGSSASYGATSTESNGTTPSNAGSREYCVPGDTVSPTCNPPVAKWTLDENTGTTTNDSTGNANTGTTTGGPAWVRGKVGSGLQFDATDDVVNVGSGSNIDNLAPMTICAWIYPTSEGESSNGRIWHKGSSSVRKMFAVSTTNRLQFIADRATTGASLESSDNALTLNSWQYVCATYDETDGPRTFVNGIETSYTSRTVGSGASSSEAADSGYIGNRGAADRTFGGAIDQVVLYNYVRSRPQMMWDYNRGGPVAWWKMDECTGSTLNDASGRGTSGTITIGATGTYTTTGTCSSGTAAHSWNGGTSGKFGSAFALDGTDDYASVGNPAILQSFSTLTISAWVNGTYASGDGRVVFSKDTTGFYFGTFDKKVYFRSSDLTSDSTSGSTNLTDGVWTHIAAIYDGSNVRLYVNGRLEATESGTGTISENTLTGYIGGFNSSTYLFNGRIDDLRIYNYPLTSTQLVTVMNEGSAIRFGE